MSINQVMLIGCRATKNGSEGYKSTGEGKSVCRFTVAIDRGYKQKDGSEAPTDFISCVCFDDKKNTFIRDRVTTRMKLNIVGRLQSGSYEKDGKKIYTTDVVVENLDVGDWGEMEAKPKEQASVPVAKPRQAAPAPVPQPSYQQPPVYAQNAYAQQQMQYQQGAYQQPPQMQYQQVPVNMINPNEQGFI